MIIFAFYGRRANVEVQLPCIERILQLNPDARFEAWNFTRNAQDDRYVRALSGDQIAVRNDFHDLSAPAPAWGHVWRHYAAEQYRGETFLKLDDDTIFLEAGRFADFMKVVGDNPGEIISAFTINNGASTYLEPGIAEGYEALGIPLLDVHMSNEYAEMSHRQFFENWRDTVGKDLKVIPTEDWVSINAVGLDWGAMRFVAKQIGTPHPPHVAGRDWPVGSLVGDEGACNMLPRKIVQGFTAAHLTFGPQHCSGEQQARWLSEYSKIIKEYLG